MKVSRHSLIFGLSYALDISGKNNLSHSKSTAYLSVLLGREIGINAEDEIDIYYAALLHDIGIGCDERDKLIIYEIDMKAHCVVGCNMIKKLPLPKKISEEVLYHHENYDGSGPFGLIGEAIPLGAQIIRIADAFDDDFGFIDIYDRFVYTKIEEWLQVNGALFSETVKQAFRALMEREYFLLDYFNHETKYSLSDKLVMSDDVYCGYEEVEKYANCFADIIDSRCTFTSDHSHGIASLARKTAVALGYDTETQNKMYIAGLLHDIGKLYIPPEILQKNGRLTPEERFEINKHAYYTRKILEQIEGFEEIVDFAANHHERMDGAGYPYHMSGSSLSELEKIMAICDVYQALTEERPYRANLPVEKVWNIIDEMAEKKHLDEALISKVKQIWI